MLRTLGYICIAWCGGSILTVLFIAIACRAWRGRCPQAASWQRIDLPQTVVDYRFAEIVACEQAREASMRRHPSAPETDQ